MEAYRDQYATLFNNGRDVVVIAISTDADTTQQAWARDADFPMLFASDASGQVGKLYGAYDAAHGIDNRLLFVVAPDGRITYEARPFRVLVPAAYSELAAAVDSLAPPEAP